MYRRRFPISGALIGMIVITGCTSVASAPSATAGVSDAVPVEATLTMPFLGDPAKASAPLTGMPAPVASDTPGNPPAETPTPDLPIQPGDDTAATDLAANPACGADGTPRVTFRWQAAIVAGAAQRVDVSVRQDGFEVGEFESSDRLAPDASDFVFDGRMEPGLIHVWRVLTDQGGRWVSSPVETFTGPLCGRDPITPSAP